MSSRPLTIAIPKGRLYDNVKHYFSSHGLNFSFDQRKLITNDVSGKLNLMLVKNSDLPTYVNHGISGLGICGNDVLYESGYDFFRLMKFDFGHTNMCLAGLKKRAPEVERKRLSVATKFTSFTRDYFAARGIPVEIIKLDGSVEIAPILGLAPYIVDLVETGSTLKANNLEIFDVLEQIHVYLIANPAYYKIYYKEINELISKLQYKKK